MKDCTFKPKINKRKGEQKRSFNQFLAGISKFEKRKRENRIELQDKLESKEKNHTYHPTVCKVRLPLSINAFCRSLMHLENQEDHEEEEEE